MHSGSEVTFTWPHSGVYMSKNNIEAEVMSKLFNKSSAIVRIFGEKNSLGLMTEFGFLPADHTSSFHTWKGSLRNGVCAGAVMILSDRFWFDDVNISVIQPFKFAGGCILPPNQLVIQYVARQQNQTHDIADDMDEDKESCKLTD